jgi:hypothetical protein
VGEVQLAPIGEQTPESAEGDLQRPASHNRLQHWMLLVQAMSLLRQIVPTVH